MAESADTTPATRKNGTSRFTYGLVIDVARVIAEHGYGELSAQGYVQLQSHLFHFLHGAERGDDRCFGGVLEAPTPDELADMKRRVEEFRAGNRRLADAIRRYDQRSSGGPEVSL